MRIVSIVSIAAKIKTDVNRNDYADLKTQHRMKRHSGVGIDSDSKIELLSALQIDSYKSKTLQNK